MQRTAIGVLLGAGLAVLVGWVIFPSEKVLAYPGLSQTPSSELIAVTSALPDGGQRLTVVDPNVRAVAVYHVGAANGELVLRSVRNIHWDLRMTQFNGSSPLPQEIRSLLEQN